MVLDFRTSIERFRVLIFFSMLFDENSKEHRILSKKKAYAKVILISREQAENLSST